MKFRSKDAHLDKLIDEAIVDCYNESEEKTNVSRRGRRVRREERNPNELLKPFCHCILTHLVFLSVLCGLERSGREKGLCLFTSRV